MFKCVLWCCVFSQFCQYPNLSEGIDRIGGQLSRDNECLLSGISNSGRIWRMGVGKRGLECDME